MWIFSLTISTLWMFMQHQGPLPAQARLDSEPNYRVQELQRARIYIYIYVNVQRSTPIFPVGEE